MLRLAAAAFAALAALALPSRAQEDEAFRRVELRVSAAGPGVTVIVDRGSGDGLAVGDPVLFQPLGGAAAAGTVTEVKERSSVVRLQTRGLDLPAGTRGEVQVPLERLAAPPAEPPDEEPEGEVPEHPPWRNRDEDWRPGLPLLAGLDPVAPEDRAPRISGRHYAIVDYSTSSDDREHVILRTGTDVRVENPFRRGGELRLDGELNYRDVDVPDDEGDDGDDRRSRLRLDRLSYSWGGTRFAPDRFEAGRFLQHVVPEFGVLDGFEWSRRLDGGDRFGASVGYVPRPDEDFESGRDLQLAAFYRWVADESERFAVTGGVQKTFHDGDRDRDLLVARAHYLPSDALRGWRLHGTAWVDLYSSGDEAKGSGLELTQAIASATRSWESGNGVQLTFSHVRFPETEAEPFPDLVEDELADNRSDRLAAGGWWRLDERRRLHGEAGVWDDEDDSGGDAELGLGIADLLLEGSHADVTVFGNRGAFSSGLGVRLSYDLDVEGGRWSAFYELANHDQAGFEEDNDDLVQQRLRITRDFYTESGWSFSGFAEGQLWDEESTLAAGFYLQKSF